MDTDNISWNIDIYHALGKFDLCKIDTHLQLSADAIENQKSIKTTRMTDWIVIVLQSRIENIEIIAKTKALRIWKATLEEWKGYIQQRMFFHFENLKTLKGTTLDLLSTIFLDLLT